MITSNQHEARLLLDQADERLWNGDQCVRLTPKAFSMLLYFVQHAGRLITKEEVLEKVWPNTYVSESLVREYVQDLRGALADDPRQPAFIETVRGRGYRFIGDIALTEAAGPEMESTQRPKLAVLSIENIAGEPRWDRFCAGIGDDIAIDLTRCPDLLVMGRHSTSGYGGDTSSVRQASRELGADYLLVGSVVVDGPRIRVAIQLIDAHSGTNAWAERFDGIDEELFSIQDTIVESVVSHVAGFHGEIVRAELAPHRSAAA